MLLVPYIDFVLNQVKVWNFPSGCDRFEIMTVNSPFRISPIENCEKIVIFSAQKMWKTWGQQNLCASCISVGKSRARHDKVKNK